MEWSAIVAFRGAPGSKSRLSRGAGTPSPAAAFELARAFARDLVDALHSTEGVRRVVVLTRQPLDWAHRCSGGEELMADRSSGMNAALSSAVARVRRDSPGNGVLILPADLPAATPYELGEATARASAFDRAYLPDRAGTGTTLLSARPGVALEPLFGGGSAGRHAAVGFRALAFPERSTLRCDVDTVDDLRRAVELGVGRHTREALSRLSEAPSVRWAG